MRLYEVFQDERIDDNTIVIIIDRTGRPVKCGRWYDNIFFTGRDFDVSFDFVEERNIAILQTH